MSAQNEKGALFQQTRKEVESYGVTVVDKDQDRSLGGFFVTKED